MPTSKVATPHTRTNKDFNAPDTLSGKNLDLDLQDKIKEWI